MGTIIAQPTAQLIEPRFRTQGAFAHSDGSVEWAIWAPRSKHVSLTVHANRNIASYSMEPDSLGYHTVRVAQIEEGTRYTYQIRAAEYPDPHLPLATGRRSCAVGRTHPSELRMVGRLVARRTARSPGPL